MVAFYIAATKQQLKRRFPLHKSIINGCCLHQVLRTKKSILDMVEALPKAVPHIGLETDISAIKDEWKIHKVEKDSNLPTFNSDKRSDHYWRSVFKIKTVNKNKSTLSYRPG